jgi:hypothetical protein
MPVLNQVSAFSITGGYRKVQFSSNVAPSIAPQTHLREHPLGCHAWSGPILGGQVKTDEMDFRFRH